jgi:DNA-binding NtrC family response regulator
MARILLVEDEIILAMSVKMELQGMGHEVTGIAESADKAISLIENSKPELILMDIVLHGDLSGIELTSIVNEQYDIPVIYGTAHIDELTIKNANTTKHFGIMYKPYEYKELGEAIQRALGQYPG